jgi:uncharacterized membrane protein
MNAPNHRHVRGFRRVIETEAHHRLVIALVVALVAFGISRHFLTWSVSLIASWDAFALSSLVLAWLGMFFTDARSRVNEAHLQDSSRTAICFCLIFTSVAGLLGAGVLLGAAKELQGGEALRHVALAALTVVSSWLLVHTMMALHYTHVFYCPCEGSTHDKHGVGLQFPDEEEPDFLDFAYFSFVIGMTCQVSDVQVTSRGMRRIVLLHGLLSFAFNTIILAFSINLAATLL